MADDETTYRAHGVTVWIERKPEKNPFHIVSQYGEARTIGRGNSFDEADIYREALEAIMEQAGSGPEYEIAEKALDYVGEAQVRKPGRAVDLGEAFRTVEGGDPPTPKQSFA